VNLALWITQALLAGMFAMAGLMKLTLSRDQLRGHMDWVEDFSPGVVKMIGTLELLVSRPG